MRSPLKSGVHAAMGAVSATKCSRWRFIHLLYLATFRNRVIVLIEWAYSHVTYERGSRLLTECEGPGVSSAEENKTGSIG